jgi:hypothetical protein
LRRPVFTSSYDLASDENRIAALMPANAPDDQALQNHVIFLFLQNFVDEMRLRVSAGE